jgi:hypothetical protein
MNEEPTLMEQMTLNLLGTSIAEQRIQRRIEEERQKREANKPTKKSRKKK